jgi:hypothetical protein
MVAIRQRHPKLPLVFASLLPLERVQKTILQLMQPHHQAAAIAAAGQTVGMAQPGQASTALYFCKDDLADAVKQASFAKLLKTHAKK